MSFKLSPNLRSVQKDSKLNTISIINKQSYEIAKLKDIILRETDNHQELVKTTRKIYNFDTKQKKMLKYNQESDEEKEKDGQNPKENKRQSAFKKVTIKA